MAFSYWLLLLANMHLSFFYVFLWLDNSFLLSDEENFIDVPQSIHLSTKRHLGCFQVSAIIDEAVINLHVYIFMWT